MTDPRMTTTDAPVTVEPQDRDLFKQIERLCRMPDGATDPSADAMQLIARHRLAALASAPAGSNLQKMQIASAPAGSVIAAVRGITDDYMTSEAHHPGYILIPTARFDILREAEASIASAPAGGGVDMILHCPVCGVQHIDEPSEGWDNPPHRSHLCLSCGHIWRPADVPTNGVGAIKTKGTADSVPVAPLTPDVAAAYRAGYEQACDDNGDRVDPDDLDEEVRLYCEALARPHAAVGCEALPEYGEWLPDVWDAYLRELVGWERKDNWARLPATFRWHEFHERLDSAILALQSPPAKVG